MPKWTPEEDAFIRAEYGRTPTRLIAKELGRSHDTTRTRANKLGLRSPMFWTAEDTETLKQMFQSGTMGTEIARHFGRNDHWTQRKIRELGLRE